VLAAREAEATTDDQKCAEMSSPDPLEQPTKRKKATGKSADKVLPPGPLSEGKDTVSAVVRNDPDPDGT
jgi:hypothetical protein